MDTTAEEAVYHLAVDKTYRRRGIARAMVERCLAQLATAGVLKCNIFVYADNLEGQKFWEAEAWVTRGDLLLMQRPTR